MKKNIFVCRDVDWIDNYGKTSPPYRYLVYLGNKPKKHSLGDWPGKNLLCQIDPECWKRMSRIRLPIGGGPVKAFLDISRK